MLSKAAVLAGAEDAAALLGTTSATGLVVDRRGRAHPGPGLEPFLG